MNDVSAALAVLLGVLVIIDLLCIAGMLVADHKDLSMTTPTLEICVVGITMVIGIVAVALLASFLPWVSHG